ncbi:hypothetical protein SNE40_005741 [Patella caerulea]|uniref:Uncharacterized protein n=1 Tax=Patella caerulea TaxID=87958 RepID=A0AAN8K2D9_PATCE
MLTTESTATLVRSLILSKLDYCNSLLTGISSELLQKLQKIQNSAARLVSKSPKCSSISPVLNSLHWLRISERIEFKILIIVYQCLHGNAPSYLRELVNPYQSTRSLRSQSQHYITVSKWNLKKFGFKSFEVSAALKWNALPLALKTAPTFSIFKSKLKTFLFSKY